MLILLYPDRFGDLRVVITMRAASLRSFSGHAALPGGKADSKEETPCKGPFFLSFFLSFFLFFPPSLKTLWRPGEKTDSDWDADKIARREASEEIGLPEDDYGLPKPFRIEQLCTLPPSLARTHLVVTPTVAFLHADRRESSSAGTSDDTAAEAPLVEDSIIPRLDAREVAAVFSAPFYNFLKADDLPAAPGQTLPEGRWYDGSWLSWKDQPWRVHNFYVPVNNQRVSRPRPRRGSAQSELADQLEEEREKEGRFKVWGMTARVLVDAARVAYGEEPEMEHNLDYGDANIIMLADAEGSFAEIADPPKKEAETEKGKM